MAQVTEEVHPWGAGHVLERPGRKQGGGQQLILA